MCWPHSSCCVTFIWARNDLRNPCSSLHVGANSESSAFRTTVNVPTPKKGRIYETNLHYHPCCRLCGHALRPECSAPAKCSACANRESAQRGSQTDVHRRQK